MRLTPTRGGRAPLDENGSTAVATRFGYKDLTRIDKAWAKIGAADRSAFIRQTVVDRANAILDETDAHTQARRSAAIARKHETRVLTAVEAELFAAAADLIGRRTPYAWGGGTITGPSLGAASHHGGEEASHRNPQAVGFDAGSLEQYLIFRAFQIEIPRTPQLQFQYGRPVTEPRAGDLVFLEQHMKGHWPDYVATYLGRGCIAEAGSSGGFISMGALPATGVHLRRLTPQ